MNSGNFDSFRRHRGICGPYNHFAVEKVGGSCSHLGAIGPRVSGALASLWRYGSSAPAGGLKWDQDQDLLLPPPGGGRENTNFPGLISPITNVYWNLNIKKIRAAQGPPPPEPGGLMPWHYWHTS